MTFDEAIGLLRDLFAAVGIFAVLTALTLWWVFA